MKHTEKKCASGKEKQMKIEDCKTVPEFFGVESGECIWVEGQKFDVYYIGINGVGSITLQNSQALVGCLTGQLEWSREEPMTAGEEKVIREIAAWFPDWHLLFLNKFGNITYGYHDGWWIVPFDEAEKKSKAYEVLAPILEKYGEINLDDYR